MTMRLPFAWRDDGRSVDVVALGENSLDFVAVTGAHESSAGKRALAAFRLQPGGQMATAALGCARLGARVRYIGAFGADEWSRRSRAPLDAAGIDVIGVVRADAPGRIAVILVDAAGERSVLEYRHPSLLITPEDVSADMIAAGRLLLLDATHPEAAVQAARWARAAGTVSIVDVDRPGPEVDRLLNEVDVVIVPEPFVATWTGVTTLSEGLALMAQRCTRAAVIVATRGAEGSLAYCDGRFVDTPGYRLDVIDTTGAGDAFRAGFAAAVLRFGPTASLTDVLRFANATAALNCRAVGAQGGLPTMEDVLAILAGDAAMNGPFDRETDALK